MHWEWSYFEKLRKRFYIASPRRKVRKDSPSSLDQRWSNWSECTVAFLGATAVRHEMKLCLQRHFPIDTHSHAFALFCYELSGASEFQYWEYVFGSPFSLLSFLCAYYVSACREAPMASRFIFSLMETKSGTKSGDAALSDSENEKLIRLALPGFRFESRTP